MANGYEGRIGRYTGALAVEFAAATEARSGQRALDVGCGSGPLAARLVEILGAEHVAAIDPDPESVASCALRLPGVDARVAEVEQLPFADAEFDMVLAQLVLGLLRDAPGGVREMARVTRPGGAVAACVWDFGDGMTVLRAFWDAAHAVAPALAAEHDQATTRPYSRPEALDELWSTCGLDRVETGALMAETGYSGFEDLWQPLLVPDGGPGRFCELLTDDHREALREETWQRLGRPDGPFRLSARAWFVRGTA